MFFPRRFTESLSSKCAAFVKLDISRFHSSTKNQPKKFPGVGNDYPHSPMFENLKV